MKLKRLRLSKNSSSAAVPDNGIWHLRSVVYCSRRVTRRCVFKLQIQIVLPTCSPTSGQSRFRVACRIQRRKIFLDQLGSDCLRHMVLTRRRGESSVFTAEPTAVFAIDFRLVYTFQLCWL